MAKLLNFIGYYIPSVFKKTKTMNGQPMDNDQELNSEMDTNSAFSADEERLAKELNTDDSMPGSLNEEIGAESEFEKLNEELAEAKDRYLRLVAEFDNFKRRNAKERNELIQTAGKDIIQNLLVVLDDTDRAAAQMEKSDDVTTIKEGVSLVFAKLRNTLQQKGLKKLESLGQPFDADLHEAIAEIPNEEMKDKVVDEIEPGYYLNDKLIRHAKVVVGR